jgi:hypothetical protein
MKKLFFPFIGTLLLCPLLWAQQTKESASRPDGHAPIHIMGDHLHAKGELMFSYRLMTMQMQGLLLSSSAVENDAVFKDYMAAPQNMTMHMHMLGIMYAPSDKLTMMLMGNYTANDMQLETKMNMSFETQSKGFGDVSLSGLIHLAKFKRQKAHATLGVSIPTGSLNQRGSTPMNSDSRLAYPMQLGSGTWDPYVGVTYLGQSDRTSWGIQTVFKFRLGTNSEGYALGNTWNLTGWYAVKANKNLSLSGALYYTYSGRISGKDAQLNPMMMPLFDTKNSGRKQVDLGIGSNYFISEGSLKNLRFAFEVKLPLSQRIEGIQMKHNWCGMLGLQYAFAGH